MSVNPDAPAPAVAKRVSRFLGRDLILFLVGLVAGFGLTIASVLLGGLR